MTGNKEGTIQGFQETDAVFSRPLFLPAGKFIGRPICQVFCFSSPDPENPNPAIGWGLPVIFAGAIALSFVLYLLDFGVCLDVAKTHRLGVDSARLEYS
jgi:hypothetical protein